MQHIPRFFSSGKRGKSMDAKKIPRGPRLERRNAAKHIDYTAAGSEPPPLSSFSSSSSSIDSPSSSLITRSLDLTDKTSFRVEGTEGDIDMIIRSLGFSGAEDFAISPGEWEARKIRSSSDLLPRSKLHPLDSPNSWNREEREMKDAAVAELCEEVADRLEIGERVPSESTQAASAESSLTRTVSDGAAAAVFAGAYSGRGGGIKGERPPLLKPPPGIRLPEIDRMSSTWDILRDFAPGGEAGPSQVAPEESDSSGEEDEVAVEQKKEEVQTRAVKDLEEVSQGQIAVVEQVPVSETGSFTSSNDDDSSSSTTDPCNISPNGRFRRSITYWQKGEHLGSGSFGSVYEGIADDGYFFAVKEVSLLDQGDQGKQSIYQLEQEIALLSQFEHENIVQYLGTDKDSSKLYIFLELVTKGSLQKLYQRYTLRDSQVSSYTRQILHGLKYLHDQNIVHRDIKCANILVDANGSVKLADFGLAKATKFNDVKSCKGTACWMAPEVVNRKNQGYGLPADIWSLGCTVLEMLTQKIPYSEMEWMQALYQIGKGKPPTVPKTLSNDARDFILHCIQVRPSDRPTAAHLLEHPFVKRPLPTTSGSGLGSPFIFELRS